MSYFRIIMPTYNNADTIGRAITSILRQTFDDWELYIVDDCSTDGTLGQALAYGDDPRINYFQLKKKRYNGGARNYLLYEVDHHESFYTLFLDADDEFAYAESFQHLYDLAEENGRPDMIRLAYSRKYDDPIGFWYKGQEVNMLQSVIGEKSIEDTVKSNCVACWTKAVRSEMVKPFPEDTLMEDVIQHLKQCDTCRSMVILPEVFVKWHRRNKSTSHIQGEKWEESAYQHIKNMEALRGKFKHDYVNDRLNFKIKSCMDKLMQGKFVQ